MLLKILQCTGQLPPQRMIWSKKSAGLMLRNPVLRQGGAGSDLCFRKLTLTARGQMGASSL